MNEENWGNGKGRPGVTLVQVYVHFCHKHDFVAKFMRAFQKIQLGFIEAT